MRKYIFIIAAVIAAMLTSCEKQPQWGFKLIYMPQAAISNNLDHEYPVPMSGQQDKNYALKGGKLDVFLGVYRSGQGDLQAYSVDVYYDPVLSGAAAASAADRVAIPLNYLHFPDKVSVEDGSRQKTFNLTVDLAALKAAHPEYAGKMLVAAIGIANPSKYELNEEISKTIIVIDSSKF